MRILLTGATGYVGGVLLDALYQPFWVEGPLKVEHVSSELAEVGYQMEADKIYAYELPDS